MGTQVRLGALGAQTLGIQRIDRRIRLIQFQEERFLEHKHNDHCKSRSLLQEGKGYHTSRRLVVDKYPIHNRQGIPGQEWKDIDHVEAGSLQLHERRRLL